MCNSFVGCTVLTVHIVYVCMDNHSGKVWNMNAYEDDPMREASFRTSVKEHDGTIKVSGIKCDSDFFRGGAGRWIASWVYYLLE